MDPSLFRIDWEVVSEVLGMVILCSFFIERALALFFEHNFYLTKFKDKGLKEPIAVIVSLLFVYIWNFDAPSIIFHSDKNSFLGYFITASIVAGGSKASVKLFHDVLGIKSKNLLNAEETEAKKKASS